VEDVSNWRIISMEELFDFVNRDKDRSTFAKPTFPTRRWGNTYTRTSTTDFKQINSILEELKLNGFEVRKRLEKKNNLGKFYLIEINQTDRIC